MGDLMHALPAITEAKDQIPNIIFDWVVDKNFSSVPNWHPAINKAIAFDDTLHISSALWSSI